MLDGMKAIVFTEYNSVDYLHIPEDWEVTVVKVKPLGSFYNTAEVMHLATDDYDAMVFAPLIGMSAFNKWRIMQHRSGMGKVTLYGARTVDGKKKKPRKMCELQWGQVQEWPY